MAEITYGGYYPGLLGEIIKLHGRYYDQYHGFDLSFEAQEARELGEFGLSFDPGRDCLLSARQWDAFVGSVAIDGRQHPELGARLRWFIVHPDLQGGGVGWRLLSDAVDFSRRAGLERLHLYTFKGLDAAARLYSRIGFKLDMEEAVCQWGGRIIEQRYLMDL